MNKFSVLISVYAKENPYFLDLSLKSLTQQIVMPNEIVLVKDGLLPDNLNIVIDNFNKKFPCLFTIIQLEQNLGLGDALNIGLRNCSYNIVARMDSDDIAIAERFEKQLNFLERNPEITVLGGWINEFNIDPGDTRLIRMVPQKHFEIVSFAKYRNPMNHMTVMFRKDAIENVGGYKYFPLLEDQFLWFRLIINGYKFHNLQEVLVHARIGNNMVGRRRGWLYFRNEIRLFNEFRKGKMISLPIFFYNISLRFILRILPSAFLKRFYKFFLR